MVSIIIPTYNDLHNLQRCLNSIKEQTYTNYEVWIIDGRSTDGTQAYLETLGSPFNWISAEDNGVYDAMNKGIAHSSGEWLYFLGADDTFATSTVLFALFQEQKWSTDLILGEIVYRSNGDHRLNGKRKRSFFSSRLWLRNSIHHQGVFYKSTLFNKEVYDSSYEILGDYAFNLALYRSGVSYTKTNTLIANCGASGISKNYVWEMYKEEIDLKVKASSKMLRPFFFIIAALKWLLKKLT
ncbi:glycosyltransferase family 2 protein [Sungkyunkwania multivorans]|uniref:Glycosyltransferase family 2 protein n=1 Tax=Sungkyunkwania multivorans TaxID=1173618 RepID=A0ABW3CU18_9FLAO